jgi:hypothetical protein
MESSIPESQKTPLTDIERRELEELRRRNQELLGENLDLKEANRDLAEANGSKVGSFERSAAPATTKKRTWEFRVGCSDKKLPQDVLIRAVDESEALRLYALQHGGTPEQPLDTVKVRLYAICTEPAARKQFSLTQRILRNAERGHIKKADAEKALAEL